MRRALCMLLILIGLRAASAEVFSDAPPRENWYQSPLLRITALSAGQSDSMLLECGGEAMMIDGGTALYADALIQELKEKDIHHFKYLFGTHYHEDHIGGLIALMEEGFTAGAYLHPYAPGSIYANVNHRRAMQVVKEKGIPERQIFHGDTIYLGEAEITLFRHDEGISANGRSTCALVRFGSAAMLLTADIIGDTQTWLMEHVPPEWLDADILKAPHHGVSAMVEDFVDAVSPEMILFNNERQEAREGIRQAQRFEIAQLCTGDGRIVLETDGTDWYVMQSHGAF